MVFLKTKNHFVISGFIICGFLSVVLMAGDALAASQRAISYDQDVSRRLFNEGDFSGGLERCFIEVSRDPLSVEGFDSLTAAIETYVQRSAENTSAKQMADKARYCAFLSRQIRSYISHLERLHGPAGGVAVREGASDFFQIDTGDARIILADDVIDWQAGIFYLDHLSAYLSGVLDHIKNRYRAFQRSVLQSRAEFSLAQKDRQKVILSDELSVVTKKLRLRDALVDGLLIHIDELESKVDHLQLSFDVVEKRLKDAHISADMTSHQMAGVSMELYSKQRQIVDSGQRFEEMTSELNELKERSELMQRIMEEKDVRIARLEFDVAQITEDGNKKDEAQREDFKSLKAQVVSLKAMFKEKSLNYQAFVSDLESQMTAVLREKQSLKAALRQKAQETALLSLAVDDYDKRLSNLDVLVLSKDKKLMELQGVVDLYSLMLKDLQDQLDALKLENRRIQERMTFLNSYKYALQSRAWGSHDESASEIPLLSELRAAHMFSSIRNIRGGGLDGRLSDQR